MRPGLYLLFSVALFWVSASLASAVPEPLGSLPGDDSVGEGSELDSLLLHAAENSPEMRSAFHAWRAAVEKAPQVRALPDPEISYGYYLQRMETRQAVGLAQAFPWFGVRDLRSGVAEREARAAGERFEAEKRRVFAAVKTAYAEYVHALEAVRIIERNRDLVERLEEVVRGLLQAGRAEAHDLLRIQNELDQLEEELLTAREFLEPAAAELNRAVGRSPQEPLPELRAVAVEALPREREEALYEAVQTHPRLRAAASEIEAGDKAVRLARREGYPEFRAGVEWMDNPGQRDEVRGTVAISLPVWRERYAAGVREAEASRESSHQEREALRQEMKTGLSMALARVRSAERSDRLYRESLVPRARTSVESIEGAYRAGRAEFLDLIESQRSLLELELGSARAVADRFQRLAELEELVGAAAMRGVKERSNVEEAD